jgi:putative acetyltransferase
MQAIQSPEFIRTTSDHPDFRTMVNALDEDLNLRNGDIQRQYDQYNKIDKIKHAIVIYGEGKPVGCGCFKRFDKQTVEMKRMFVLPEMRGKKLAAKMLQELENWAIEEGFVCAVLETGVRQVEAQRLYSIAGYSRTENYGQYVGMEDSICYSKELKWNNSKRVTLES